jgi:hypothetical protein
MVIFAPGAKTAKASLSAVAAGLLLIAFLVFPGAGQASAATYANFNRETYKYSTTFSSAQEAGSYRVMVLQWNDEAMVPMLHAANPNLKILMYEGIMAAQNQSVASNTCTAGPTDLASHPSWILHNQSGQPIINQNHYLVDVGNSAYQQTCMANVIATAKKGGFDGVYWDMVNSALKWVLPSGTTVPEYPADASWQAAMYSMLSYAGSQLHANRLLNIGNIGGSVMYPGLWQRWNGPMDGAEEESWTDDGTGLKNGIWAWPRHLAAVAWSEANGKMAILHSWDGTRPGNSYGLASMMLIAGGQSSYSTSNACYSSCETFYPEYATAQQLGAPVGPYTQLANGVYTRRFQNGIVLVNPTANTIPAFALAGGPYTGSGLTDVTSVGMAPTSGYILIGPTGAAVASPPPVQGPAPRHPPVAPRPPATGGGGASRGSRVSSAAVLSLRRTLARVHALKGNRLFVTASCPAHVTGRCTFRVAVYGPLSAVRAGAKARKAKLLGTGRLTLRPGQSGKIVLNLNRAGRRALLRGQILRVWIRAQFRDLHKLDAFMIKTTFSAPRHPTRKRS